MKVFFAGNRYFVLEEIIKLNLDLVKVFVTKDSFLHKILLKTDISFEILTNKKDFIEIIKSSDFDLFVSNGLSYILPISELNKNNNKTFINIHPSYLPDLKGANPTNASILFKRDSGATCHIMNDMVDSGNIISRIKIPYSYYLDVNLLYQLSFLAEKKVFLEAYAKNFQVLEFENQYFDKELIYYSFNKDDLIIKFSSGVDDVYRQIRAFNNSSKGAYFYYNQNKIIVYDAEIIKNDFMSNIFYEYLENQVVLKYESTIIIKKGNMFLSLKNIVGDITDIEVGSSLA